MRVLLLGDALFARSLAAILPTCAVPLQAYRCYRVLKPRGLHPALD